MKAVAIARWMTKKGAARLALAFLTLAGAAALASEPLSRLALSIHPSLCSAAGGKWASVESRCVTRSCYRLHDCGHWAHPAARCSQLSSGAPIAEAYFQLGEPDGEDEGELWWWAAKASDKKIVIHFENGALKSLTCP
jgi:hypothetical protein